MAAGGCTVLCVTAIRSCYGAGEVGESTASRMSCWMSGDGRCIELEKADTVLLTRRPETESEWCGGWLDQHGACVMVCSAVEEKVKGRVSKIQDRAPRVSKTNNNCELIE